MKFTGSVLFLVLPMFGAPKIYAQATCPSVLKWTDATYAQRTTTKDGHVVQADTEVFRNASIAHLNVDGVESGIIEIFSKNRVNSIQFTLGHDNPNPVEFAEISMVVTPPMANEAWPRMMGPCSVPDDVSTDFDEDEIPAFAKKYAQTTLKFKGTLLRTGLRISYSMFVADGESWQGEASYNRELKDFDMRTDVQGWHVYRANSYVETLPIGKPISVLSVIEKMALREQTK
jgi:hypothetical protein